MKKIKMILVFLILLIITIPSSALKKFNFFSPLFTEPIEKIYFIMKDGTSFYHTNNYGGKIYVRIVKLEETLKRFENENYEIKDIALIIHNHLSDCRFSPADRTYYRRLREKGFNGLFMLYSNVSRKTYCLEENIGGEKKRGVPAQRIPPFADTKIFNAGFPASFPAAA